ncbi:MAG TPA: ATP-binding protein [Actinomycetes bacterium]|nr:ATP-binding protein [Actinomycetes bacterium]
MSPRILPGWVRRFGEMMPPAPPLGSSSSSLTLPHDASSAREARIWVMRTAVAAGMPPELVDDVALVVSELVTNAVRHARPLPGGTIEVTYSIRPTGHLVLCVRDGGPRNAPPAGPGWASTTAGLEQTIAASLAASRRGDSLAMPTQGGRGLGIVGSMVDDWGVDATGAATTVWAEVDPRRRGGGASSHHPLTG